MVQVSGCLWHFFYRRNERNAESVYAKKKKRWRADLKKLYWTLADFLPLTATNSTSIQHSVSSLRSLQSAKVSQWLLSYLVLCPFLTFLFLSSSSYILLRPEKQKLWRAVSEPRDAARQQRLQGCTLKISLCHQNQSEKLSSTIRKAQSGSLKLSFCYIVCVVLTQHRLLP